MAIISGLDTQLLHPKVIHFPIALFISAMGLELLSLLFKKENLHRTAVHIYILATIISPLVVLTGLLEADRLHLNHPILSSHKTYAFLTMYGSLITLPILWMLNRYNQKMFRIIFLLFILIIVTFVSVTAYNGGRMVYEYGVGVEE